MKKNVRLLLILLASWLPPGTLGFTYRILCQPRWLRCIINFCLLKIIPSTIKLERVSIVINKKDPVISGALMFGVYEPLESKLFKKSVKIGQTVIDIGANIGYYTALAAQEVGNAGKVIAFEPEPDNFFCLKKTIKLNGFTNVECQQLAISDQSSSGNLYLSPDNMGDQQIYDNGNKRTTIPIKLTSLDFFLKDYPRTEINVIKMDIQGSEGLALKGMFNTLQQNSSIKLFTEFWAKGLTSTGVNPHYFLSTLKKLGFFLYEICEIKKTTELITDFNKLIKRTSGNKYTNLFCVRKKYN
ncbi:MAG: FkbM family methyltransferase [Patescibacteria group bacterium]